MGEIHPGAVRPSPSRMGSPAEGQTCGGREGGGAEGKKVGNADGRGRGNMRRVEDANGRTTPPAATTLTSFRCAPTAIFPTPQKPGEAPSAPSGNSQQRKANDSTKQPGHRPQANTRERKIQSKTHPPKLPKGSKRKGWGRKVQNIEIVTNDIATLVAGMNPPKRSFSKRPEIQNPSVKT